MVFTGELTTTGACDAILAVNAGSSSLKITFFDAATASTRLANATIERIGLPGARLTVCPPRPPSAATIEVRDFDEALRVAVRALHDGVTSPVRVVAAGHRIVHGGAAYREPAAITPAVLADLEALIPLAPTHMPQAVALVESLAQSHEDVPQFACFDTAFHRTVPRVAQLFPLSRSVWNAGIRRYGFHGLSCESIVRALGNVDPDAAVGRLLIAHLGNGSSVTAVHHGRSIDTSMGFTPTGGLMMGTRSGDLDPGVLTHLARTMRCTAEGLERLVTHEAGLLGISGVSSDVQELLARTDSPDAQEAVALYCYTARKHFGALAAALDGLDTIVFTGGIGEHAATIRSSICEGLGHLGVAIDDGANAADAPIVSRPGSRVTVRVMHTDEDLIVAGHVRRLMAGRGQGA